MEQTKISAVPTFLLKTTQEREGQLPNIYVGVASSFGEARDLVIALEKRYGDIALELKMLDPERCQHLRRVLQTLERLVDDTEARDPVHISRIDPIEQMQRFFAGRIPECRVESVELRNPRKPDRRLD